MAHIKEKTNQLINEKSPYLLQHAYNPVNWHPWSEETFKIAKKEDKPIFLSIGYSTCYWCHVMEREVFENEKIAEIMNDYFINIKVDREERPEIDRIYMIALQAMTGSGGWPMSIFLTPDLKPFYGATYIPPKAKYGRAGFEDVINEIHKVWTTKKDEVIDSSEKVVDILNSKLISKTLADTDITFTDDIFHKAFEQTRRVYDDINGGFGEGNKFPRPVVYNFLLDYYYNFNNEEALDIVTFTLQKMFTGGMFDHLAGGFHRYSVDNVWRVPHFEKMLYDQAQLVSSYIDVYKITGKGLFLEVAALTLGYVLNNLTSPEGGFYSAEDAESALDESAPDIKEEGAFYLWEKDEIEKMLGEDAAMVNHYFGIQPSGNTISDPHEVFGDKNVLYIANDIFDTAKTFNKESKDVIKAIDSAKKKLLEERDRRPKPHLDDKILTSWNGLMISAFTDAYEATGEKKYLEAAEKSAEFILHKMYDEENGVLLHRYRDGDARFEGSLEDYSYFVESLINLYEADFKTKYLSKAIELNELAVEKFYDKQNGGFFDTEPGSESVILDTKETYDGAEPSGNSVQLTNLIRLSIITDNAEFMEMIEKSLRLFYDDLNKMPFSSPQMLTVLSLYLKSPKEIIISGNKNSEDFEKLIKTIRSTYVPEKILLYADDEGKKISPFVKNIVSENKDTNVYVCENYKCELPVNDVDALKELLANK